MAFDRAPHSPTTARPRRPVPALASTAASLRRCGRLRRDGRGRGGGFGRPLVHAARASPGDPPRHRSVRHVDVHAPRAPAAGDRLGDRPGAGAGGARLGREPCDPARRRPGPARLRAARLRADGRDALLDSPPEVGPSPVPPSYGARTRRISVVSAGTTWNRSPTIPKSATRKIGALGSELIATITRELSIPTRCWIAPEIPTAM